MIIPVIISGGAGTRLWPVSRESDPKPFMKLPDGNSIIGKTFLRAMDLPEVDSILVVTNKEYYFRTKEEFDQVNTGKYSVDILLEPFGKNTAPAIGMAAHRAVEKYGDDVTLLVLPADHLIPDHDLFSKTVGSAVTLAKSGALVTFGIEPDAPETGFGYIEKGENIVEAGFKVSRFVEKPDRDTAQEYLDSRKFVWNSGMFCFKAGNFLAELKKYAPEMSGQVQNCWAATDKDATPVELDSTTMSSIVGDSIDYAVMEKAENVAVVSASFDWNDIGSWNSLSDVYENDEYRNAVSGDVIAIESHDCIVKSENRLAAIIGLKDIVVVDDEDAFLVMNKEKSQDVKKVIEQLKYDKRPEYASKLTTRRPWGEYVNLVESDSYKVKVIKVFPGQALSLQKHMHRSEHWTVVKGRAEIVNGDNTIVLEPNSSTYIEKGAIHRLTNIGEDELQLIEVQYGEYLGEDDIIRLEDVYGRG